MCASVKYRAQHGRLKALSRPLLGGCPIGEVTAGTGSNPGPAVTQVTARLAGILFGKIEKKAEDSCVTESAVA